MPKITVITVGIIALILSAGGFWWWQKSESAPQSAVFQNDVPDLSLTETTAESPSPEEKVEAEIAALEAEKEEELVTPSPVPAEEKPVSSSAPPITNRVISWGYTPKESRKIDTIILHSSYNSLGGDPYSVEKIIAIYKDYEVGAHYILDRKGTIYRLVEDKNIAYHAGASKMPDGRTNVNDFSIGIELINNMEDTYTGAQYEALNELIDYLENTYGIKHVVGHSDIAPGRKTDPWNFDWKKLKE